MEADSADTQDEAINPLAQYGFRAEERSLCDLILAGARDYQAMQPAVEKQFHNRNSHAKVVKDVAPDPRSQRSSSSVSNDSADDEDNEDNGVRDCRRYMSPASRRQYPGTAHSDNQAILAQRNSAFQSGSEVLNPAFASAELDDADELQAIVNKCFHCVTLPSLQEVFFPSV